MKIFKITLLSILFLISCKKSVNVFGTDCSNEYQNMILNYSFEKNGVGTFEGWNTDSNLDSTIQFSDDIPQSGGHWSAVITIGDRVFAKLWTNVVAPAGTHYYRLSVFSKTNSTTSTVKFYLNKNLRKSLTISDSTWKIYQVFDTLTTTNTDTLIVELDGGVTYSYTKTFFDLCRLEKKEVIDIMNLR